jgi:hypothetical protein
MKSHVRENMAKNALMNGIRFKKLDDTQKIVELSEFAWNCANAATGDIKTKDWIVSNDSIWSMTGTYKNEDKTVKGTSPSDCFDKLRECFGYYE